jgi:subtilisin family serine protease
MQAYVARLHSGDHRAWSAPELPALAADPLALVNIRPLMARGEGAPEIVVGLIDGPVARDIPSLATENIRTLPALSPDPGPADGAWLAHGTAVASVLSARRSSNAPGICPGCTLLVHPVFRPPPGDAGQPLQARPGDVATAVREAVDAGAHVLNVSAALAGQSAVTGRSAPGERLLAEALDAAMRRGTLVVAAAGNQEFVGGSAITAHPWVIPVAASRLHQTPQPISGLGATTGRRGLFAPGERIVTLNPRGDEAEVTGTSVATPFVTGTVALLRTQFPAAPAAAVRYAVTESGRRRRSVMPPLLDAWAAYHRLRALC